MYTLREKHSKHKKLTRRLRRPSVDVAAFSTSTACCDLDLWPSNSNQVISTGGGGWG